MVFAAKYAIFLLVIVVLAPNVRSKTGTKLRTGVYAGIACVSAFLIAQVIQAIIPRPRPFVVYHVVPLVAHSSDATFPSDYATVALSWVTIWVLATRSRWLSLGMGLVTGLLLVSRIYVALHFPSDMFAGAMIGILVALAAWRSRKAIDALATVGRF